MTTKVEPGGGNTNIQFNDNQKFGGNTDFTWDNSTSSFFANTTKGTLQLGAGPTSNMVVALQGGTVPPSIIIENEEPGGPVTIEADSTLALYSDNGSVELQDGSQAKQIEVTHDSKIGFFGAVPVARPTVTGSRSSGAALASLLTSLVSLGIIIDNSTE